MTALDAIMSQPIVYRLWMAPFAEDKFAPILKHNDMSKVRRVLDVGCGPGTNTGHFAQSDYLGIDLNPEYIETAKRLHGRRFLAVDAAEFAAEPDDRFDFILLNSFLHHVDKPITQRILSNLTNLLTPDGRIHIVELVLPPSASIPRFLARADRGRFARPMEEWQHIFDTAFQREVFEPLKLTMCGVRLWEMVYFKGRAKLE
jgi:SAM-dependent methyltransferase